MEFNPAALFFQRAKADKTQAELSQALGKKHPRTYIRWEKGETLPPKDDQIKLAKILGCDVTDFYIDHQEEFRSTATTLLVNLYKRNVLSPDAKDQRIAVEIFKHMFPNPLEIRADLTVSNSEAADADLLDEGDVPECEAP